MKKKYNLLHDKKNLLYLSQSKNVILATSKVVDKVMDKLCRSYKLKVENSTDTINVKNYMKKEELHLLKLQISQSACNIAKGQRNV